MGSKNKLKRFKENETFKNVIQPTREELVKKDFVLKGKWNKDFFKNDNPLVLELGCGKGEYSVELGRKYPKQQKELEKIANDLAWSRVYSGNNFVSDIECAKKIVLNLRIYLESVEL